MGSTTTTTLKLPDDLKTRIAPLAEAVGKTPHAWMVAALEAQTALAEMRELFIADAQASAAEVDAGGPLYAAEDVHAYIVARASGRSARRPAPTRRATRKR
jgi:predicted transcriptional regulator